MNPIELHAMAINASSTRSAIGVCELRSIFFLLGIVHGCMPLKPWVLDWRCTAGRTCQFIISLWSVVSDNFYLAWSSLWLCYQQQIWLGGFKVIIDAELTTMPTSVLKGAGLTIAANSLNCLLTSE